MLKIGVRFHCLVHEMNWIDSLIVLQYLVRLGIDQKCNKHISLKKKKKFTIPINTLFYSQPIPRSKHAISVFKFEINK